MMLAVLEANPHAFSHRNINALLAGATLCFEPADTIEIDEGAAVAEVFRHNREWSSGRAPVAAGSHDPVPDLSGGEDPATLRRPDAAGSFEPEPTSGQGREQNGLPRLARAVAGFGSHLARVEDRIGHLEAGARGAGATRIEEDLARLAVRVTRIEDRIRALAATLETASLAREAPVPMPAPAPLAQEAMEPMPTPAPLLQAAIEAMEPMPTPAPLAQEAMEPMPTPAPQVPGSDETLTTESVSARIAEWRERVRELRNR